MRMTKLKLSGFKSFVDPTTIPMPSNLIGIVGPNGCGKSNTIDAVRWVMGEISAKHLRGDSMADVIFNGSSSRKPIGQASVELVFDNSDGKLTGQYAHYTELAIKRMVSRDGQSNYYLNNTKCRRRDIQDIFLGTGLGPRSYAIIEQGMISKVIDAKPEELRGFLEEAAGISKYKERRKETERRIGHTRENLDRLNDLREEIDKRLAVLQRQAKTAEKYKELKEEERKVGAEFTALKWRELNDEVEVQEKTIREQQTALEQVIAEQRHIEAQIEQSRDQHIDANDQFNEVQGRYYAIGGEIGQVEQSISHHKELRTRQETDLRSVQRELQDMEVQIGLDRGALEHLHESIEENQPALEGAQEKSLMSSSQLHQAEEGMQRWQQEWDQLNQEANGPTSRVQVERTRVQHAEGQVNQFFQRISRIEQEIQTLIKPELEEEIQRLQALHDEVNELAAEHQEGLNELLAQLSTLRERNEELASALHEIRGNLQDARGRRASLEALQQAALGKGKGAVTGWLEKQGLANAPRLAEKIRAVDAQWQKAVETVLGAHLQAVCVDGIDPVAQFIEQLDKGSISFFETASQTHAAATSTASLADKVTADLDLRGLLGTVLLASSLEEALQIRAQLIEAQSVITPDGLWMGKNWLRVSREKDETSGVLGREQELKELKGRIEVLEEKAVSLQAELEESKESLRGMERQREERQIQVNQAHRKHGEVKEQLGRKQTHQEQNRQRQEKLTQENSDLQLDIAAQEDKAREARGQLEEALNQMADCEQRKEQMQSHKQELQLQLSEARAQARQDQEEVHHFALRVETAKAQLSSTEQSLERLNTQFRNLQTRMQDLAHRIGEGDAPLEALAEQLEALLQKRIAVEKELTEARRLVEELDQLMRNLDQQRSQAEQKAQEVRQQLEKTRMAWQGIQVRRQTLAESIDATGFTLEGLFAELPQEAMVTEWAELVDKLAKRIQNLGAINLAAIEEYQEQSARKEYLDAQNADLVEALTTLENAIRKIDRETRTRFKETFDKVNAGVQRMFPRLFGGGHAYLEMTGDDLLNTGISIFARPPGKRLSSIHLMSGGEKALTAVALVFAIFELNPSPFCMLDEVDAPLDDANVGRFCELVKEMSEKVQFIFITHNKITMELADYLTGVTMHEPGVSRMVAVDVDEAARMAAS